MKIDMLQKRCVSGLAVLALIVGCDESRQAGEDAAQEVAGDGALAVYAVNYPLQYFAQRIGGDLVRAEFRAPHDVDPAYWAPEAEAVASFQSADLILLNGAGYAAWVDRVSLPSSKQVNTSAAFADRLIVVEDATTHSHGPAGEHSHGEIAFTTWLDPTQAIAQARAVKEALAASLPESEPAFQARLESLERELTDLDLALSDIFAATAERPLLASHPVYQYFGRRYGLDLVSVHFEPDVDPGPSGWRVLEGLLEEHRAAWMLWEAEPLVETADRLRELGIEPVVFEPCANVPKAGDYMTVMKKNLANLDAALARAGS